MIIKSDVKFSSELLISAPRRSPVVPSPDGNYALYTVSTYSLDTHTETREIKVINLKTEETTLFSDDGKNIFPQWLGKNQILWLKKAGGGKTEIWIGNAGTDNKNAYRAGEIDGAIDNVKTKELPDGKIALGFSAFINEDGTLHNAEKVERPLSSAREYETINVRFWDSYYTKERSTFWYTTLERDVNSSSYKLSKKKLINALEDTGIEFPSVPADMTLLGGSVEMGINGILLVSRDPDIDMSKKLTVGLWYLSISSYDSPPQKIQRIKVPGFDGFCSAPSFSLDEKAAAFLATKTKSDGIDYNRIFVIHFIEHVKVLVEVVPIRDEKKRDSWDLSPTSVLWSNDGTELYVIAEERARVKLWKLPIKEPAGDSTASLLNVVATAFPGHDGSVSAVYPLNKDPTEKRILINKTSFVDSGMFYITDPSTGLNFFSSLASNGTALGLQRSQVSEINFPGRGDYQVQAWVLKPSHFDKNKKYPLVFLIHGGPAGTWPDAWSTRWNPAVWAEQGYIVVLPNPTGSTSFGHEFAAAIEGDWGGRCYDDLVKCFEYVEKNMPFVDIDRAVAAGASFGGYMINWIAGQPLSRRFKTLICHDGIFSNYSMLSSDVPVAQAEDMGGHLWDNKKGWDKYDPAQFTQNWKTPMLFIHSDRDYRCPITEGLAPYHVCQMRGIPSRFLNFPDENHFVLKRENSLRWYKTVLGWANKYAGVDGVELEPPLTEPRSMGRKQKMVIR